MSLRFAPAFEGHAQDLEAALGTGIEEGRVADIVLGIHIGTRLDQQAGSVNGIGAGGRQQRRTLGLVAGIDFRAGGDQRRDAICVIGLGRTVQFGFHVVLLCGSRCNGQECGGQQSAAMDHFSAARAGS